jgi:hypothetical protein
LRERGGAGVAGTGIEGGCAGAGDGGSDGAGKGAGGGAGEGAGEGAGAGDGDGGAVGGAAATCAGVDGDESLAPKRHTSPATSAAIAPAISHSAVRGRRAAGSA